jgi:hypothetical protein
MDRRSVHLRELVPPPPDDPALCETCRARRTRGRSLYCSRLCHLFDVALGDHLAALVDADGDRDAPAVILSRTRLRVVALVYDDEAHLIDGFARESTSARDWREDVDAGRLLPIDLQDAVAAVYLSLDVARFDAGP